MKSAQYWIDHLQLTQHPEGGYFREVYRSEELIPVHALPERYSGKRPFATHIYFLITFQGFSAFHRLKTDEIWHFYAGNSAIIHMISEDGDYSSVRLGQDIETGETFQAVVSAGCWFAAQVLEPGEYALVGCTMAPGFDFADFEMADREKLSKHFPIHGSLIQQLTRQ